NQRAVSFSDPACGAEGPGLSGLRAAVQQLCLQELCPEQGSHPGVHLDFEAAHPDIASSAPCIAQLVCGHIESFERLGCSRRQAVAADLRPE
ncbi:unnamed protein product, partial [Effrenium voratum]